MNARATLSEKIASLPDKRIQELMDFVDFLRMKEEREREDRELRRDFAALSEPVFAKMWDNPRDAIYDDL
jgi:hypothetical protein